MKKSFEEWMKEVNVAIEKKIGLGYLDLPDCPYHDWYNDRVRANTAASRAVKECFE